RDSQDLGIRERSAFGFSPCSSCQSSPNYSYLRHSIGSKRDALRAGQTPKINPMATLTDKPETTAHIGIEEGRLGIMKPMSLLMPIAATTPITPPRKVRVIASNKN